MNLYQDSTVTCNQNLNHSGNEIHVSLSKELSKLVLKALFMEVSIKGKPGLIGPDDNFNEQGINYTDYVNSIITLQNGFRDIIEYAFNKTDVLSKSDIIWLLQKQVEIQQASLKETYGELDNNGIILTMGIVAYAAALTFKVYNNFNIPYFRKLVVNIYNDSKLITNKTLITSFCDKYNVSYYDSDENGLNKECNEGLPLIFDVVFPVFIRSFRVSNVYRSQLKTERSLYNVLLLIMSEFRDLSIVRKNGYETLIEIQKLAKDAFNTNVPSKKEEYINRLKNYCDIHNIVPKGAANLLSVGLFIFYLTEL